MSCHSLLFLLMGFLSTGQIFVLYEFYGVPDSENIVLTTHNFHFLRTKVCLYKDLDGSFPLRCYRQHHPSRRLQIVIREATIK